jgi:hypothetical protein
MCGNMKLISSVDQNSFVNTRNKFRISERLCIFLFSIENNRPITLLIIYMKMLLDCDWLIQCN